MSLALRDYQAAAHEALRAAMRRGIHCLLLVSPTGSGKSTTVCHMIESAVRRGKRTLFVVAGVQLVSEFSDRLAHTYGIEHGVLMAAHPRHGLPAPVQVASVDTLAAMLRRGARLPPADLIIVDEADLARADRFESVLREYPNAFVVGMTATPIRLDGQPLGDLFEEIVEAATPRQLIERGYLSAYDARVFDCPDSDPFATDGAIDAEAMDEALANTSLGDELNGDVLKAWQMFAGNRRTVGFARNRRHSRELAARFNAAGIRSEHMDGEMPLEERREIFERIRRGQTMVLWNVGVVTRGVDLPCLEVAILACPTNSIALHLQECGRILRPSPETQKGRALILDHAGNLLRCGFPDEERKWSLDGLTTGKRRAAGLSVTICPQCFRACESGTKACPECGAPLTGSTKVEQQFKERAARILLLDEAKAERQRRLERKAFYEELLRIQEERGYRRGWATHRYTEKYGQRPALDLKPRREVARAS